jgi:hypothetical protein
MYGVIVGTDIFKEFKGHVRYRKGQWRIKMGRIIFKATSNVDMGEQLGVSSELGAEPP